MPSAAKLSGAPWSAQSSGGYAIANGWLALFGPRPGFIFRTQRCETTWQQWQDAGRYHGLAKFRVGADGLLDAEPVAAAIPERKQKCWVSSRQFAGRC